MEPLEVCPINNAHLVKNTRYIQHVIKCIKNNPQIKLIQCVYNARHWIAPEKIDDHCNSCPDARKASWSYVKTVLDAQNTGSIIDMTVIEDFEDFDKDISLRKKRPCESKLKPGDGTYVHKAHSLKLSRGSYQGYFPIPVNLVSYLILANQITWVARR